MIERNDRGDRNERSCRRPRNEASICSLKKRLQKVDFAIIETVLYLDAHPHCRAALEYYGKLIDERRKIVHALAEGGAPVSAHHNASCDSWDWVDGPWPWHFDAN